jgi:hypothetical protein
MLKFCQTTVPALLVNSSSTHERSAALKRF